MIIRIRLISASLSSSDAGGPKFSPVATAGLLWEEPHKQSFNPKIKMRNTRN